MPTSTTRKDLRQKVIKRLYAPRYPITSTTTSSGSTTAVNDTGVTAGLVDNDYLRAWLYIVETVSSGPTYGEISRVSNQSTGVLTVSPAFSATVQSDTDYELHYWFHPNTTNDMIDDILGNLEYGVILPLTLIPDGSMEATGTSNWGTTSNASVAKNTTAANVINGTSSLAVTSSAADGYVQSDTVSIPPNSSVLVSADVVITAGDSAKLELYDVTNSASIETAASAVSGKVRLQFTVNTPATCEQIAVRLYSVGSGDVTYWDNVVVHDQGQSIYDVPSDAEWHFDVKKVLSFPKGRSLTGSGEEFSYKVHDQGPQFHSHFTIQRQENAATAYRVELEKYPGTEPLWMVVDIDYPAFSGATAALKDADTTKAPLDIVVPLTVAGLMDARAEFLELNGKAEQAAALLNVADRIRRREVNPLYRQFRETKAVVKGAMR